VAHAFPNYESGIGEQHKFRSRSKSSVEMMIEVPFADLYAQYRSIETEINSAIQAVIRTSAFVRGPFVDEFEKSFSELLQVPYCVSCANGTDALYIAMRALGVGAGDEVVTTAHSWIATSEAITQAGGRVIFCDTDAETFTIDPAQIEAKITSRTVGIIPVHLYGQPADMAPIMAIARKHRLWVIEDCAQAHLAQYRGQLVGSFGDIGTFSFYPGKNLGAMGDAGALTTRQPDLARRMAMFSRHGGLTKGEHEIEGINSRLDGIQAAILSVKLKYLPQWTVKRQALAQRYSEMLAGLSGLTLPVIGPARQHVFHLYVVRHKARDELAVHLNKDGIQTVVNYPVALPFLPAYSRFDHLPEQFPRAFSNQSQVLSLPIFAEMSDVQQKHVVDSIHRFCDRR
jgi:dTDP-4-amino-4,6-dideoxygalactose transaminase